MKPLFGRRLTEAFSTGSPPTTTPCGDDGQDCQGLIYARSVRGVTPSRHITWFQAQAALANSASVFRQMPSGR